VKNQGELHFFSTFQIIFVYDFCSYLNKSLGYIIRIATLLKDIFFNMDEHA